MPRNQGTSRKGKPKKNERAAGMGRSLQKSSKRTHTPSASQGGMAMRQGVESINIQKEDNRASVLEVSNLDDFLIQAEMANREFASQKEQFVLLDSTAQQAIDEEAEAAIPWDNHEASASKSRTNFAFQELSVPRRPAWDETTTPEELDRRENESFLDWRRAIAMREEEIVLSQDISSSIGVTPFEKNLEMWRQLWRVMERVSCIVQIVDARNPLFYLSKDLTKYATKELGKPMLLLVNKSDYLSPVQRKAWHEYFSDPEHPSEHVFFSAHKEQDVLDRRAAEEHAAQDAAAEAAEQLLNESEEYDDFDSDAEEEIPKEEEPDEQAIDKPTKDIFDNVGIESPLTREELLEWLWKYGEKNGCQADLKYDRVPFGMVGFPNVGKSSVINVLMGNAKFAHGVVRVGVAAQPGKTKHFQTLLLPDREKMLLCDCPGLVFPSFVNNTADLIAAGVFPIAQMRDPFPVVDLLCKRIPRQVLNAHYGIQIPMPSADAMLAAPRGSVPPPTVDEFLTTYCVARSMLASSSGVPDFQRASRIVIKEYAAGRLLYCHAPPHFDFETFQKETLSTAIRNTKKLRDKLLAENASNLSKPEQVETKEDEEEDDDSVEVGIEEDDMLLELMGGTALDDTRDSSSGAKSNNKASRQKKWGKKGRKFSNKDPYGCHSTPDESLVESQGSTMGVSVKAGKKHSHKNYVRPTGYGVTTTRAVLG
jgi:large subunit GTPase 1